MKHWALLTMNDDPFSAWDPFESGASVTAWVTCLWRWPSWHLSFQACILNSFFFGFSNKMLIVHPHPRLAFLKFRSSDSVSTPISSPRRLPGVGDSLLLPDCSQSSLMTSYPGQTLRRRLLLRITFWPPQDDSFDKYSLSIYFSHCSLL